MNKLVLLIILFLSFNCKAIDSLDVAQHYHFTEKDLLRDNASIQPIHFEKDFKKNYTSNDFNYKEQPIEKGLWQQFIDWLRYWLKQIFGLSDGVSSQAVKWIIYTISTLIVLFVVYLIVKSILNKEGQWIFGKSTTKKIISYDDIERNLKDVDFEKLIKETLKSGDKRLAIRYYYLWILKRLSEKSIIEWNPEKTNSDYSREIQSEKLKKDFDYVSYLYNYIWYGEFEVDEATFENARRSIEVTLKSI